MSAVRLTSETGSLAARMAQAGRGCNAADVDECAAYREVSHSVEAYPLVSISIVDDMAVVHLFRDADACFLLDGDQVVDECESREFRILDVDVAFSGAFICTAARAQAVVEAFMRGAEPDELGSWTRL